MLPELTVGGCVKSWGAGSYDTNTLPYDTNTLPYDTNTLPLWP